MLPCCTGLDNRGTGDSDRPPGLWSMDDLARDALAVLDAAGHDSAHVLGVSMGGMVAQDLALGHPERVRGSDHSELLAVDPDQSNFRNRDLTIESMRTFLSDGCNLPEKISSREP